MPKPARHPWTFARRFRKGAFGWKSQPAIQRIREAVAEIKKVARKDPVLAAVGAVMALSELGKDLDAIRFAEESRGHGSSDHDIDRLCEGMLMSRGQMDDAYRRYGLWANRAGTYTAWFRAVAAKYPHKQPAEILADLVAATPGEEGKWFATAKDAGLYELAIELANRTPCSPQTLTRAARAFVTLRPDFAIEAGMTALRWLVEGYGYEITGLDVLDAYTRTMNAAKLAGCEEQTQARIRELVAREAAGRQFVSKVLRRELGVA